MAKLMAGLTVLLGLVLVGCGTAGYDTSRLTNLIRDRLDQHPGFHVQSVDCPPHAKLGRGVVVRCSATLLGGHTVGLRATELDNKGTVHLVANEVFADNVERAITSALAARGVVGKAACPQHIPVALDRTFHCAVTAASGRHARATVTIVDRDGGFSFRVRG